MRRPVLATSLALLIACGSSSPSGPAGPTFSGTFTLTTINGKPLPYTPFGIADNAASVAGDVLTFKTGGAATDVTTINKVVNGSTSATTQTLNGTYVLQGNIISVFWDGGRGADYIITSTGLVLTVPGVNEQWVYKKQ